MSLLVIAISAISIAVRSYSLPWTNYTGFTVSTGWQNPKIPPSTISDITSTTLNSIQHYRFFGWPDDREIAESILAKSSSPQNMKFHITIFPDKIKRLASDQAIAERELSMFLAEWSVMKSNIYSISLGFEPTMMNLTLDLLPTALTMVHEYLQSQSGWEHIRLFIPFSMAIILETYPVYDSSFKQEYQSDLKNIIRKLSEYNGFFGINVYPFFVLTDPANSFLLGYCLGIEGDHIGYYNSLVEAQYDATYYAIQNLKIENVTDIEIAVTETGWSSYSDVYDFATVSNAVTYIESTLEAMNKPGSVLYDVMVFFFELVDENIKENGDWEPHFGFYDIDGIPKYWIDDIKVNVGLIISVVCGMVLLLIIVCVSIYYWYAKANIDKHTDIEITEFGPLMPAVNTVQKKSRKHKQIQYLHPNDQSRPPNSVNSSALTTTADNPSMTSFRWSHRDSYSVLGTDHVKYMDEQKHMFVDTNEEDDTRSIMTTVPSVPDQ